MAGPSVRRAAVAVDAVCGGSSAGEESAAAAGEGSHAEFASVLSLRVPEFPPSAAAHVRLDVQARRQCVH